ncbi:MAG: hypothetical protein HY513_03420 [Candidatus Aenigmarchaeota archaeon]|nr:hypothetical protein [Candidatus Aenigmarchaeota archaeon]
MNELTRESLVEKGFHVWNEGGQVCVYNPSFSFAGIGKGKTVSSAYFACERAYKEAENSAGWPEF